MTNYVGGPGDDDFLITYDRGSHTVTGGGGFDRLIFDLTTANPSTAPTTIFLDGNRVAAYVARTFQQDGYSLREPIDYFDIDQVIIKTRGQEILIRDMPTVSTLIDSGGSYLSISARYWVPFDEVDGTWVTFGGDMIVTPDLASMTSPSVIGIRNFGQLQIATGTGNDQIRGGDAADTINGYFGDDMIEGGAGDDQLQGGDWGFEDTFSNDPLIKVGMDTVSYAHAAAGVTVSLALQGSMTLISSRQGNFWLMTGGYQDTGGAGTDQLAGFENIRGSAFDDRLTGDDSANGLLGEEGDDGGNSLWGEAGNDVIEGGPGDDMLDGGAGIDSVSYQHSVSAVTVSLLTATGIVAHGAGSDIVQGFENIRGSAFDDRLEGDNGVNVLSGLAGADTMAGLGGDDEYWVDNKGDVVIEAVESGYDRIFAKVDYTLPDHVEVLTLIGRGNIDALGNDMDNVLIGNSGTNRLRGLGGEDMLIGGAGDDVYYVNSAGDRVIEAPGEGDDIIVASFSIDLRGTEVEQVRLVGSSDLDVIGSAADNDLRGNAGNNILRGGNGNDGLTGGAGRDIFAMDVAPGAGNVDRITDYSVGEDRFDVSQAVFGASALGQLAADAFVSGRVAADADDRIIYDRGSGEIFYDADGSGSGVAILFAAVTPGLALSNVDFLIV